MKRLMNSEPGVAGDHGEAIPNLQKKIRKAKLIK
jgi:hypothetical protein